MKWIQIHISKRYKHGVRSIYTEEEVNQRATKIATIQHEIKAVQNSATTGTSETNLERLVSNYSNAIRGVPVVKSLTSSPTL